MKNSIFNTASFLLLLITLISCSSEDNNEFVPTLPGATQIGANTFGCYVDGVLLTPRDGTGTIFGPDNAMSFFVGPDTLPYDELKVRDFKSGTGGILKFHFDNLDVNGIGIYTINESNCQEGIDANHNINITCRWLDQESQTFKWYCSIENGGTVNITFHDPVNRIVSATFNCTLQNKDNSNEFIEITEGRFDIHRPSLASTQFP